MSRLWRPRLVAHEPLGAELGELPHPLSWTFTQSDDSRPTLELHYPASGAHASMPHEGCEIAVQYPTWAGAGDDRPDWTEPIQARLVHLDKQRDRMDRLETWKYTYVGIEYLLDRAWIQDRDVQDPLEGDQRAERTFPDAPGGNCFFGKVIGQLWTEVVAATGWGGSIVGLKLHNTFTNTLDSNDELWTVGVPMVLGLDEPISNAVKRFVEADAATVVWSGRDMNAYDTDTYHTDLSDLVVIRDSDFVMHAPQVVDWQPPATHVRIIGAEGRTWDFENLAQDQPHGTTEMVTRQHPDVLTEDDAEKIANHAFAELKIIDQLTAEVNFGAARLKPWQDYNLWTTVKRDRGRLSDERKTVDTVSRKVRSISVTVDQAGVHGHVIFGDRRRHLGERAARQVAEMGRGSRVGPGGLARAPGDDPRTPDISAVTAPTLTFTSVVDHNNRPRGQIEVTQLWDSSVPALDPDGEASATEIRVSEWVFGAKRTGKKWKEILRVPADDTSTAARVEQLWDQLETINLRRAAVSHAGKISAWQTLTDATWTEDVDAALSADLVLDSNHSNAAIRDARWTAAGAGFAFTLVSDQYVADFTSTSPELNYSIGGTQKSGRRQIRVGDQIVVDCEALKAAGTSVTLRVRVRWYLEDGTVSNTLAISQAITSSSYATFTSSALTAPAGARSFAVLVASTAMSGTTPKLRVRKVNADRRTVETRMADNATSNRVVVTDAVDARTIIATDPLTTKHTVTGPLVQSHSGGTTGAKLTTSGIFYYISGSAKFSATSSGVFVTGTLTTGSGMVIGGAGLQDIQFPSGSSYSIGESGGYLEIKSGGSGVKVSSAFLATGAITGSLGITIGGTTTLNGSTQVNGSGTSLGFYGASTITKPTVTGSRGGNAALASALTQLANLGLIIDGSS